MTHDPDNEDVTCKNNRFNPLLERSRTASGLQSLTNPGIPAVNNLLNSQTFNDMFENDVLIADALARAQPISRTNWASPRPTGGRAARRSPTHFPTV